MGKDKGHIKLRLAEFTSRMVGKPYRLGEMDCAKLIMEFADHMKVALPDSWQGIPVASYKELFEADRKKAMELFIEWATSIGNEISPGKAFSGDLLIAIPKGSVETYPSLLIHAGQDQALCVTEKRGVCHVPIRAYNVIKAFRWKDR